MAQVDESNPNVIDGMTVIGAAGGEEFNARIAEATDNNFIYGGQAYDCAIILALAVEQAGTATDGDAIIEAALALTGGDGTECDNFADCLKLIQDGEAINYNGASGAIDLDDGRRSHCRALRHRRVHRWCDRDRRLHRRRSEELIRRGSARSGVRPAVSRERNGSQATGRAPVSRFSATGRACRGRAR